MPHNKSITKMLYMGNFFIFNKKHIYIFNMNIAILL
uniref:Uncharacterized protein n=1 Tax=viral metagenome TaxID=1070528 RepID=A0A6C0H9A0_9ZZZZ